MADRRFVVGVMLVFWALWVSARPGYSQEKVAAAGVPVHMVIGDEAVRDNTEVGTLSANNVQIKQGRTALKVKQLVPARGENAALQLFIAIDDTCDQGVIPNIGELRDFVNAQPPTTAVAIGYMSNATIQVIQNFTTDQYNAMN